MMHATPPAYVERAASSIAARAPHFYALGDSMTFGYGTTEPKAFSFPADLARANGFELTDLGISGIDTAGMLEYEAPYVKSDAALVTIWIGVNDEFPIARGQRSLFTVVGEIAAAVNAVHRQAPRATIMLMTPIDPSRVPGAEAIIPSQGVTIEQTHAVDAALAHSIEAWGLPVCDVSADESYYADPSDFFTDGFHPSNLGAQHIANDVNACIHGRGMITR